MTSSEKEEKNSAPAMKNAPEAQKHQEKQTNKQTKRTQGPPLTEEASVRCKKAV